MRVSAQRRVVTVGAALCVALAAPTATAGPAVARDVVLTNQVELRGSRSASIDVRLPRDARVTEMFDVTPASFDSSQVGSGFALINLDYAGYPPTLIGLRAPHGARSRRLLFPFGDDRRGNDVLETQVLPRGRYRLYLVTDRQVTVHFRLAGLPSGRRVLSPARREAAAMRRVDASMANSPSGEVLPDVRDVRAPQNLVVLTAAALLRTAPRGYDSFSCLYPGGAPAGGVYLPHCLNAPYGTGTGIHLPIVERDYLGFGAFVNVDPGRFAVSRSVEAPGQVIDQTSYFLWLPMPRGKPAPGEPSTTLSPLTPVGASNLDP